MFFLITLLACSHSSFSCNACNIQLTTLLLLCHSGNTRKLDDNEVAISGCHKGRCRLRKRTTVSIEMILTPDHDVKDLTTSVSAIILGIPLPFIGVDGTSARKQVYLEDGTTTADFPLKSGANYVYRNSFEVLPVYPVIPSLDVHWALTERNGENLVCFQLPAKITAT